MTLALSLAAALTLAGFGLALLALVSAWLLALLDALEGGRS